MRTTAWTALAASSDLSVRSSGTRGFFSGLTLTISGFTPTRDDWTFPTVNGAHAFAENDLSLLTDDAFSGIVTFRPNGPGAFLGQVDLGTATHTIDGIDPIVHDHTWLRFALFQLQTFPEAFPIAMMGGRFQSVKSCFLCGLFLRITVSDYSQTDPYPMFDGGFDMALLNYDGTYNPFGLRTGKEYHLHAGAGWPAGDGGTFNLSFTK